jgi:hypothetical protein
MQLGVPVGVPNAEGPNKRPRGRLANVGHFHDEASMEHFIKVIFEPRMDMLPIANIFRLYFGSVLGKITRYED